MNRIGVQGYAGDQAVSLYRYYRKLTTAPGQPVNYSDAEVSLLNSMQLGALFNANSGVFSGIFRRSRFSAKLAADVGISPLDGSGTSVLPRGAPVIVTGHSLGGHLALLFGRMFPSVTEHVYTYNAPGISPIGALGLWTLGVGQIDPAKITNIAAAMGAEAISLIPSKPGEKIAIFTEAGSRLYQHSIVPLTDSLALYGALATLSPGLSGDPAAVSGIISAASPYSGESLEAVLDALRATLGVDGPPTLIARDLSDLAARDGYYQNLYALLDVRSPGRDYRIESLVSKPAGELASMAGADVSVRFALDELMPFAAANADFSSFEDSFSGQWLASRAEWLAAMLDGNLVDRVFGFSGTADNVFFRDIDSGSRYSKLDGIQGNLALQVSALADRGRIQEFLDNVAYNRKVVFGSDSPGEGDQLLGLSGGDRLLGAAGDDTLDGAGGDDYLEGGPGEDLLFGGPGDDTLNGGEGTDRLEGGPGSDTYIFAGQLDTDTIVDRDGQIYVGDSPLTGGFAREGEAFRSGDGRFSYEFSGDLASEGTLVVNGALRVEGFRNGDLGIRLVDGLEQEVRVPVTSVDLLGDFIYEPVYLDTGEVLNTDEYGNPLPETRANHAPGREDQDYEFPGTPGNTHFDMAGGDDLVQDLLGGDDYLELGTGDDAGWGGSGNDIVEGGPGRDLVAGGRGNDVLYAGSAATLEADLDDDATPVRTDGGDLLSGGEGDDTLFGDAESNLIEGGAGRDRIFGGAGDDWIGSDVSELALREGYGFSDPNHLSDFGSGPPLVIDLLWRGGPPPAYSLQAGSGFASPGTATIGSTTLNPFFRIQTAGDADEIDAGPGNDTVVAGEGDDLIFGGAGDDYIDAGEGADTVFGGDGDDYVQAYWDAIGDYIDLGDGNDAVQSGAGDDILIGGPGNDRLSSIGGNDILIGGDGDDFLAGFDGGEVLDGGPGDDTYTAVSRSDGAVRIRMGRGYGADFLEARIGTVVVDIVGDVSPGEVTLAQAVRLMPAPESESGDFETLAGIELRIGAGADSLFLIDSPAESPASPLSIEFADGTVWDDAYLHSLLAPADLPDSTQAMAGTAAGDLLYGTAGPDIFSSSQGDDWLLGDAGSDVYQYAAGDGFDLIEDTDSSPGNSDVLRFANGIVAGDVDVFATGDDYVLTAGAGGVRIRGGRTQEGAIERVEFSDATSWSAADLAARAQVLPDNRAPQMPALLGRVAVDPGSPLEIAIPEGAISDPDRFDSLSYYAVTADGDRLPGWLAFDATSLTFAGTPAAGDAGSHEILLIAADANGAASIGTLTIAVGGSAVEPEPEIPAAAPDGLSAGTGALPVSQDPAPLPTAAPALVPTPARGEEAVLDAAPAQSPAGDPPRVGVPADPLFRDMQQRFDVLLQTGRTNLGERYADAIREFEERRLQREEAPPPPPTDEEVEAWNSAMHSWHDRNPGFAETDLGGNDGTWTMGWGLPGPGDSGYGGTAAAASLPGLANPLAQSRLSGAGAAPMLGEGLREIR